MERTEKLRLSMDFMIAHAFRLGLFMRLYEASLCWFVHYARPLKIMPEVTRQRETLLYGGLPIASFEALAQDGKFSDLRETEYGFCWNCQGQSVENTYPKWREEQVSLLPASPARRDKQPKTADMEVLDRLKGFELARATPLEAMNAIASWQSALRGQGKEGA